MISIIVATLGERDVEIIRLFKSLEQQTYKNFEVILVSQGNHKKIERYLFTFNFKYKHIKINKKGLSLARNVALKHISGDIITFSDDDCWYLNDSLKYIHEYFEKNDSDIVSFQHFDPYKNEYAKKYPKKIQYNLSKRRILSQSSIDIFINIKKVIDYKIGFDERFGVGSKYNSGEENIYLMDLYNRGYKIDYYPKIVSYHPNKIDLTTQCLDANSVVHKAALFKRLFGNPVGIIMYIIFIIKKKKYIVDFFHCFKEGILEYIKFKI